MYLCRSCQELATVRLYLILFSGLWNIFAKVNVALNKSASASHLFSNSGYNEVSGPACLAVNGNTDTTFKPINQYPDSPTCVHTAEDDYSPYWEVDLGQQYVISTITVYGREQPFNTLKTAKVTVDDKLCYTFASNFVRPIITQITCSSPLIGRKVRIQKVNDLDRPYFQVCQVQVWVCSFGYYDPNCTNTCGKCLGGTCDPSTGECPQGCSAGFQLPYCKNICTAGSYGVNCSNKCGNCSEGSTCSAVSGECPRGCQPGYQGANCNVFCGAGSYGFNCSNKCGNCSEGSTCSAVSGECPRGCQPGYQGAYCNVSCRPGTYGASCTQTCGNCTRISPCNIYDGSCETGCSAGYKSPFCKEACRAGTYGEGCTKTCGSCRDNSQCNISDGSCETGCAAGYKPPLCKDLETGKTGDDCNSTHTSYTPTTNVPGSTEKACSPTSDTNHESANTAGPIAGAVVGSVACGLIGFLLGVLFMRHRHRQRADKNPSAACFSAPLKTVHNPHPNEVRSTEPAFSSDYENANVSTNVYDSLKDSRDDNTASDYTSLAVKRTGDVNSSPYVNTNK